MAERTIDGDGRAWAPADEVAEAEAEVARLLSGLELIIRESEQFPDEDGIGAGTMARNLLVAPPRKELER